MSEKPLRHGAASGQGIVAQESEVAGHVLRCKPLMYPSEQPTPRPLEVRVGRGRRLAPLIAFDRSSLLFQSE